MTQKRGLKTVPSVVQLPGGIRLSGVRFRITDYDHEGRPKTFEILPISDTSSGEGICTLFADETWIRKPGQKVA